MNSEHRQDAELLNQPSMQLVVSFHERFQSLQFPDREINGSDLIGDLSNWLRQHKRAANGLILQGTTDAPTMALAALYERFKHLLRNADGEASGADTVDALSQWLGSQQPLLSAYLGSPFEAQVARSGIGDFFGVEDGWGACEDATAFFVNAPAGIKSESGWSAERLATALQEDSDDPYDIERQSPPGAGGA